MELSPEAQAELDGQTAETTLRTLRGGATTPSRISPAMAGRTDIGREREKNQDQFLITELDRQMRVIASSFELEDGSDIVGNHETFLLAVADGIGSRANSEIASAVAIDALAFHAMSMLPWLPSVPNVSDGVLESFADGLRAAVTDAQAHLRGVAARKKLHEVGTTLTVGYVVWPALYVVHVGDSRAYLCRGGQLQRLTRDHTMAQELADQGFPDVHERFGHILTNSIGGSNEDVKVDLTATELQRGDVLMLCSDGLSGQVDEAVICQSLTAFSDGGDPKQTIDDLIDMANDAGGRDNVTVVCARF